MTSPAAGPTGPAPSAGAPRHVYLDHAATTVMSEGARAGLVEELSRTGNASSLHSAGRRARRVVEEARERIGRALGARPSEVIFTAGGTESDNLAIKGLFWARRTGHPERRRILISAIEHHAVLDPVFWLAEHAGAEVVQLPVDGEGLVDLAELREEVRVNADQIALISVMWANNEVGTVQPVHEVVQIARSAGIPVHSDAVQAVGSIPVDFEASGLDAMTLSGHKLGGPLGVGALVARRGLEMTPILHGGGQERGVRSGTLDTPAVHSFSIAVDEAVAELEERAEQVGALRDALITGVLESVPGAQLRGPDPRGATFAGTATGASDKNASVSESSASAPDAPLPATVRLPGNAHFTFSGCEGDSLLFLLDSAGVECSTGSACQAGVPQPSHVLIAMGLAEQDARGALRFSLGRTSLAEDVGRVLEVLPEVVERARRAGSMMRSGGL